MNVKFLGTAAAEGWPGLFCQCQPCRRARREGGKNIRSRSSCLIDGKLLIDFPSDTYMHILNNNIDLGALQHLIITHSHLDHFYPLDLILRSPPYAYLDHLHTLNIYGNDKVTAKGENERQLSNTSEEYIKFREVFPFEPFKAGDMVITPLLASHDRQERCYIYIIEVEGKTVLYGTDSGYYTEQTWKALHAHYLNGVILDCTNGPDPENSAHLGFPGCKKIKEQMLDLGIADINTRFIITHFSHNGGLLHKQLEEMAGPYDFDVAYDGADFII